MFEAESAEAACAMMQSVDAVDLVVTDVMMPGVNGLELAAKLRAAHADVPVVFIAGFTDGHDLTGEQVLAKPFSIAALNDFMRVLT